MNTNSWLRYAVLTAITAAYLTSLSRAVGAPAIPAPNPTPTTAAPVRQTIRLWPGDAPGAKGATDNDIPTLTVFPAPDGNANGAAIVVCPGGGYGGLAMSYEGVDVAKWLNTLGITGAVLKYRLGSHGYRHPIELGDVQRAIRTVRSNGKAWGVDPKRVGVLGFSAGGHLASTAATHFDAGNANDKDPIERQSSRPDLAILVYPVITMSDPYTHGGSRDNLLGKHPDPKLIELLSNEKQVTPDTPPCFLVHGMDDKTVPVQNSIDFALACRKHNVPCELHLFEHGPHGFGLGGQDPELKTWPADAARWLAKHDFATN
ncbi:MAG TPA: alpha/beta hydrolase [Tepidisphaeraceae bacterium]|nr:alpha/beta hydrolase [Tepidisphaeraceae bacterium]